MLKEIEDMNDDPFFKPKMQKREEEIKRKEEERRKKFFPKIKLGLRNIKRDYKNKKWSVKGEELFLQIFSKFHLNESYNEYYGKYTLENENDEVRCILSVEDKVFDVSYYYIWEVFKNECNFDYEQNEWFIENMFETHFKLNNFTLQNICLD